MIDCYSLATYVLNVKRVELGLTRRCVCRCMEQKYRFDTEILYTTYITYYKWRRRWFWWRWWCDNDCVGDDGDDLNNSWLIGSLKRSVLYNYLRTTVNDYISFSSLTPRLSINYYNLMMMIKWAFLIYIYIYTYIYIMI